MHLVLYVIYILLHSTVDFTISNVIKLVRIRMHHEGGERINHYPLTSIKNIVIRVSYKHLIVISIQLMRESNLYLLRIIFSHPRIVFPLPIRK